jgi:hypothetical protein
MPPDLERAFAKSALPAHLRDGASVWLLDPASGYRLDHAGTNGFNCFVARTEWEWVEYRDDLFIAISLDAETSRTEMPHWFDMAALRAQGTSPSDLKTLFTQRFADGTYGPPARTSISYMLAPVMRTYMYPASNDVMTMNGPHVMVSAPGVTNEDIGALPTDPGLPFINKQGPQGWIILLRGAAERARITTDAADLVNQLCAYRSELCLDPTGG